MVGRGGNPSLFWGCEQFGMLTNCSLTPSCPRAGDPRGKSTTGVAGEEGEGLPEEEQALKG